MLKNYSIILLLLIAKFSYSQGNYNRFALGINGGLSIGTCDGDFQGPGFSGGALLKYSITNRFALRGGINFSQFDSKNSSFTVTSSPLSFEFHGMFNVINFRSKQAEKNGYRPIFSNLYLGLGGGAFSTDLKYNKELGQVGSISATYLSAIVGYKFKLNDFVDLNMEYNFRKTGTDLLDGYNPQTFSNKSNDYFGSALVGININLGAGNNNIEWTDGFEGVIKNIKPEGENGKGASKKDYDVMKKRVDELEAKTKDSDKDGVTDMMDKEINSPTIFVDKAGVTLDTDGDNIPDYIDKCPLVAGTNQNGCAPIQKSEVKYSVGSKIDLGVGGIQFEPGKAVILPVSYDNLNKVVNILSDNLELELRVEGHTDNLGVEAANLALSKARAIAVKKFLIENNIDDYRIIALGFGSKKPIASNKTPKGRRLNRRVDFIIQ
ncbi:MAG: OmpA family protein [Bacteroidia bacterium]|nr:OmpA family protein [Bacteroidia bacterium]